MIYVRECSIFYSRSFTVYSLTFRFLIHFELIFVYGAKEWSNFTFFTCGCPVFPAIFVKETVFPTLCNLASFVIDELTMGAWFYFWIFLSCSIDLYFYFSILFWWLQLCSIWVCKKSHGQRSLVGYVPGGSQRVGHDLATKQQVKSWNLIPPASFFFLKIVWAIWCLLCLHKNFKIFCSSSVKHAIGNLIEIALNL